MEKVLVYPTGLVDLNEPDAKVARGYVIGKIWENGKVRAAPDLLII